MNVGGIVGTNTGTIEYIANYAILNIETSCESVKVGGIIGGNYMSSKNGVRSYGSVAYCYNSGNISIVSDSATDLDVGTIVGHTGTSSSNGVLLIENCYSVGELEITGVESAENYGYGLVGHIYEDTTVSNCYYLEDTLEAGNGRNVDEGEGVIESRTSGEMQADSFLDELNVDDEYFVSDTNNINNGYPILYFQTSATSDTEDEETKETYTLYLYDGTTLIGSTSITEGDTITISDLEEVTKDGYTLTGWVDENGNSVTGTITVTGDITLYASWTENTTGEDDEEDTKETYMLYLYDGDELYGSQEITEGDYVYVDDLPTLSQSGYTFNGWEDQEGNIIEDDIEVTDDIYLYASWTEEEEEESNPVNSDFDSATAEWTGVNYYFYSDDTESYVTDIITIENITRYISENDSYKYYYYISNSSLETDIEDWIEITESQTSSNSLTFEINFDDIPNYDEIDSDEDIYIYIKEIAIKDENESTVITDAILLDTEPNELELTIYLDDEVYFSATYTTTSSGSSSGSSSTSTSTTSTSSSSTKTTNSTSSTATTSLPDTGIKSKIFVLIALFVIIAIVIHKKWNDLKEV